MTRTEKIVNYRNRASLFMASTLSGIAAVATSSEALGVVTAMVSSLYVANIVAYLRRPNRMRRFT